MALQEQRTALGRSVDQKKREPFYWNVAFRLP